MARSWWWPPRLRVRTDVEEERHATWLELFYDLVFVVAIAELAANLNDNFSPRGLIEYLALFIPVWWTWVGAAFYATRFDTDDAGHRLFLLAQMFVVATLAVEIRHGIRHSSAQFALSYSVGRALLVAEYLRAGRNVPEARPLTTRYSRGFALAAFIWMVSAFVPPPGRFIMWAAGLAVDFGTPTFARLLHAMIPPHTSHMPERFGLFTLIVLGETVAGAVRGLAEQRWGVISASTAAFGLALAFGLWWIYFEGVGGAAIRAAIVDRRVGAYQAWLYAHLLLALGIVTAGAGVERAVLRSVVGSLASLESWLLGLAIAACFVSFAVIHQTMTCPGQNPRREVGTRNRLIGAASVLLVGVFGNRMPPVAVMALLAAIGAVEVLMDTRERGIYHVREEPDMTL